jgi:hypothetical protein
MASPELLKSGQAVLIEATINSDIASAMRWSAEGAHLLLQVRCAVVDKRLDSLFHEWCPNFRKQLATPLQIAAHPHL